MTHEKETPQMPQARRKPVLKKSALRDLEVRNKDPKGGYPGPNSHRSIETCICN